MDARRHLRQVLLAEVGTQGQARIAESTAAVAGAGLAGELAELYARGAGFAAVSAAPGSGGVDQVVRLEVEAARDVLAGSRRALAEIRRALGLPGAPEAGR